MMPYQTPPMSIQPFQEPLISGDDVITYLPQRPPMIVVDTLWEADAGKIVAGFTVREDHVFVDNGMLSEPGIMEYVAQTAALGAGYGLRRSGEGVKTGFIGSYKDVRIGRRPLVGEVLTAILEIMQEIWNCTAYTAQVFSGDDLIAQMEIKLFTVE